MSRGKLKGLPTPLEMKAAMQKHDGRMMNIVPLVREEVGQETASLFAVLDALEAGLAERPRGKGRQFSIETLRAALMVLHKEALPLTSGSESQGPARIAERLGMPLETARSITSRLAELLKGLSPRI